MSAVGTLTFIGRLVATSCWCGIGHAIPEDLYNAASRDHTKSVYCPLGHEWVFTGETEAQKLARQLTAQQEYADSLNRRLTDEQNHSRAVRGVVTKLRKAAINGQCAFCHRHFANVARHMATQHPREIPEGGPA
jgi:hypothetical protein